MNTSIFTSMYMHVLNIFLQFDGQTFKFDIPVRCKKETKYQKKMENS